MNPTKQKLLDLLVDLKENYAAVGVKAEFEDEGTRLEEMFWLGELAARADLELIIKIGGCGAIRDMYDVQTLGASRVVAPMIEGPYALRKFLEAMNLALPREVYGDVTRWINIETVDACDNTSRLFSVPNISELYGIVLGRVDLSRSMGLSREKINDAKVFDTVCQVFASAKLAGLKCAIGGGISLPALPFLRSLPADSLVGYETRKVAFGCPEGLSHTAEAGIMRAVEFELLWLKFKRHHYASITNEDQQRITMLESRQNG